MKKPELLMPAGSPDVLKTAIAFGADAVYVGGDLYSLRAKAKNFSEQDIVNAVEFCHKSGRKLYVTVNITAHNEDLAGVKEYLQFLNTAHPDGLIISDPGVFMLAKEYAPCLELHVSTQANNVNYLTYRFWYDQGAKRAVSARELSIDEIRELRANIPLDMEIESFVHGAMCISYSGRCLLSNYLAGRDANMGECTHPCRWKYYLMEETRPGEYMPVEENERGTYIFNSKDLCMVDHIPELVEAGVDSFKIEGRMKTALYVATVTRAYRAAIDDYFEDPLKYKRNIPRYLEEVAKCTNRRFTTGFFFGKPSAESLVYENSTYVKDYIYFGTIESVSSFFDENVKCAQSSDGQGKADPDGNSPNKCLCRLEQKNKFCVGDTLEVLHPGTIEPSYVKVISITDDAGNLMESCPHASQMLNVVFEGRILEGDILRGGLAR
ncbi:MAG: U32 family peptidase [Lachnospiraceae bacterium]|nr:U32 family peptidase [Lachnospiraceae bacterium]